MPTPHQPITRRPAPVSIRFSNTEKALLRQKADGMPLGTYIKQVVLGTSNRPLGRQPVRTVDAAALGQILGFLGQSRLANNLNQLAKAVNLGALPVQKETEADIRAACANIALMRECLLIALGQTPKGQERLMKAFRRTSGGSVP